MIKKYVGKLIILNIMIVILITCTINAYAISENNQNFASVSTNKVTPGSEVNISLNLKDINYKSYTVKLSSNTDINKPLVTDGNTGNEIQQDTENKPMENKELNNSTNNVEENNEVNNIVNNIVKNTIVDNNIVEDGSKIFTLSNISNLNNIILTINIPEDSKVGSNIVIDITITDTDSDNKLTSQITFNVVEKIENDNTNFDNKEDSNQETINSNKPSVSENQNSNGNLSIGQNSSSSSAMASSEKIVSSSTTMASSSSTTQSVSYNGSSNNYLSNIYIDGVAVCENFNKTNSTYFKKVEEETTSVDISYDKYDSNSTVCVYGNTNLAKGLNKILITVTAENGSVRNYRIYISL